MKLVGKVRRELRRALRVLRALRLLLYPIQLRRIHALGLLSRAISDVDVLSFVNRRHYLSRFFDLQQRLNSVLAHYQYEQSHFNDKYQETVHGGNGLVLWEERVDDTHVSMRLVSSREFRSEGEVSIYLYVNEQYTGCIAYSYIDGASLGTLPGTILFVSRIQVNRGHGLALFRQCYPQNSPQYFCLAAVMGVAKANDATAIAVIAGKAQVNYEPQFESGFLNTYCNFWHQFGARSLNPQAYVLDVPLQLPPLASIKHRARASKRRRFWSTITTQSEAAIRAHRFGELAYLAAGRSAALFSILIQTFPTQIA